MVSLILQRLETILEKVADLVSQKVSIPSISEVREGRSSEWMTEDNTWKGKRISIQKHSTPIIIWS